MPPTSETPQTPPPAEPPVAPAPQPVVPPVAPSAGIVPPVVAPAKSKAPLIIGIVAAVVLLVGAGGYFLLASSKKKAASTTTSSNQGTIEQSKDVDTSTADLNCGAKLSRYPNNPATAYVMPDNWPTGFNMHDSGDEDSVREFCQGAKLKTRAEEFMTALSGHDWAKAFTYLTKAEAAATTVATRSNEWKTEYGAYTFPPVKYPVDPSNPASKIDYAIESCIKNLEPGWSKKIKSGYYKTPDLLLDEKDMVTTQISLAMSLEDGIWKVVGDNNKIHNTRGVVDGDAYSQAQNDRKFSNFWECE